MPPKTLTVEMQRTWWEYAAAVAVDQRNDAAWNAIRGPLKATGDLRDIVAVPVAENALRGLLAAGEAWKDRPRTAEALRWAIGAAEVKQRNNGPNRPPRSEPKAKPKPDPTAEMREALRLMHEAGELSDDEIAAAKAKGML